MDRQDIMTEGLIDLSEAPTLRARRDALGRLGRYAAAGLKSMWIAKGCGGIIRP